MPDISKTSEQSLNNILNKLGVKTQEEVAKVQKLLLDKKILKLMTTQLQIKTHLLQWTMVILLRKWHNFQQLQV